MPISENERLLLKLVSEQAQETVDAVTRDSERPYDLSYSGKQKSGTPYRAWLPLAAIHELTEWWKPEIANLTSYPEITRSGDWSGVRDSAIPLKWVIFNTYVLEPLVLKGYLKPKTIPPTGEAPIRQVDLILSQQINKAISDEIEAIRMYGRIGDMTTDPDAKAVFKNIAKEEMRHKEVLEDLAATIRQRLGKY